MYPQIEDLSQQAQMNAVEKFKTPEPTTLPEGATGSMSQAIPEESDEDEPVST